MQIILNPINGKSDHLRKVYSRALREATELYVATAYLTDWAEDQVVGNSCKQILFIVGTDFGLSRKAAMRSVLRWMPKHGSCVFLAAPRIVGGGFHPKVMAWRSKDKKCYALIGSSNLSKAAFAGNYEANIFCAISTEEFHAIEKWLEPLIAQSIPVTEDWVESHYKEAALKNRMGRFVPPLVKLALPKGPDYARAVQKRRKQQAAFSEIGDRISAAAELCAKRKISDSEFWTRFWNIWSHHASRFQGSGIQFTGKSANWGQACRALIKIRQAARSGVSQYALDAIVSTEIDRLVKLQNPARGAWLSEMLCHYFPDSYPILNSPVTKWLKWNKWRGRKGSSQGQRYTELAKKLRHVVAAHHPAGARNLAELDHALWLWVQNHGP
jgi:hypothetical protein